MLKLIRALFARIKALFAADAALEIQAEIATRSAERKAALYRLAARYDEEGLASVAHDLRRQAEALHLQQTFGDVVPAIDDLVEEVEKLPAISTASTIDPPKPAAIAAPVDSKSMPTAPARQRKR